MSVLCVFLRERGGEVVCVLVCTSMFHHACMHMCYFSFLFESWIWISLYILLCILYLLSPTFVCKCGCLCMWICVLMCMYSMHCTIHVCGHKHVPIDGEFPHRDSHLLKRWYIFIIVRLRNYKYSTVVCSYTQHTCFSYQTLPNKRPHFIMYNLHFGISQRNQLSSVPREHLTCKLKWYYNYLYFSLSFFQFIIFWYTVVGGVNLIPLTLLIQVIPYILSSLSSCNL